MSSDEGRSYDPSKDATAQEPLTQNEVKLVTRLFGDPFAFPMEFKAWLRGWLEEQYPRLGGLGTPAETGAAGAFVPPAGSILDYAGATPPGGYVLCDGAEYDKTSLVYQRLFSVIGYAYGTGSTGNMFRVPDFRERVAVMKGALVEIDTLGDSDGLAYGSRGVKHRHTLNWTDPGHGHGVSDGGHSHGGGIIGPTHDPFNGNLLVQNGSQPLQAVEILGMPGSGSNIGVNAAATGISASVGPVGAPPVDSPSFLVVNKIISLGA